jgi:hypothetical protein
MQKRSFDFESALKLENYVRKRYRNQLSNGALTFYLCAFRPLEIDGLGLCQPITANYQTLAEYGIRSDSRIREVLNKLNGVLCEVEIGKAIMQGKEATRLRRYTLHELMKGEPQRKLIDYTPVEAKRLVEILRSRAFVYGDETACRPHWNVTKTGRVQSARPHVQNDPENMRISNLCCGLGPGEVLINADYKSAEPTLIQSAIGFSFDCEPYEKASSLLGISREAAKIEVNSLAYQSDSVKALSFWNNPTAAREFKAYARALTEYKNKLWKSGEPKNNKRRYTNTLAGRKIDADRGKRVHRGQVLSWQIQGTVADILNAACLEIIEQESSRGWRLCFPEYDAAYVIGKPEQAKEVGRILEAEAARLNLPLKAMIKTYDARGVVCKCE